MSGASSKQIVAALACLSVLAVAAFHAVLANHYTYDAIHTIRDNPHVARGAPLGEIFRVPYWDPEEYPGHGLYRPLAVASFWVTRALFRQPLRADHVLDVGLQVACGLLVMLVLMELGTDFLTGLLLASVYVVHPIQTEVVSSLVGRCDLLATFFALLALHRALRGSGEPLALHRLAQFFALASLSLLAKESALLMFVLIPAAVFFAPPKEGEAGSGRLRRAGTLALPLALALAVNVAIRHAVLGGITVEESVEFGAGAGFFAERWGALAFLSLYVEKALWPTPLLPDYATGVIAIGSPGAHLRATLVLITGLALVAWIVLRIARDRRLDLPELAVLLFWIAILPVCNLVLPIGTLFGERLLHLPLVFLLMLALNPWLCREGGTRGLGFRPGVAVACGLAIVACVVASARRVPDWHSNRSLFAAAVRDAPGNFHAQMSYATALLESGPADSDPGADPIRDRAQAWQAYQATSRIRPLAYEPYAGLGKLALQRGELRVAAESFRRALVRAPPDDRHLACMNLAQTHRLLGEADPAEVLLLEAVDLRPDFAPARRELGDLWSTQGRIDEALAQYELALASESESPAVWQRVIWAHLHLGHDETARRLADRSPPGTLSPAFNERLRREGWQLAGDFGL